MVPRVRYFSVASPRLRLLRSARISSSISGSANDTLSCPRTAMALRFFDPITAPGPVRPACLPPSLAMPAYRTRFSPAGPILATLYIPPSCALTARSVADVPIPTR